MKKFKRLGSILISGILLIGLVGCGASNPSKVVTDYFKEVKSGDARKSKDLIKDSIEESRREIMAVDDYSEELVKILVNSLKKLDFKINNEVIIEDEAIVNVTVKGDNISKALGKGIMKSWGLLFELGVNNPNMTKEESDKILNDAMAESLRNTTSDERTGDLTLIKVDKKWVIESNEELYRLVLGEAELLPNESAR